MDNPYQAPNSNIVELNLEDQDYELASRWKRLGAQMIDYLLQLVAIVLFVTRLWGALHAKAESSLGMIAFGIAVYLAINGYLLAKNGQTVGKKLFGIRIVGLDGDLIGLPNIIIKRLLPVWICGYISNVWTAFAIITIADLLFIFRADKRCIHDFIAGTRVVVCND